MYRSELFSQVEGIEHGFGVAGVPLEQYVKDDVKVFKTHQVHGDAVHVLDDLGSGLGSSGMRPDPGFVFRDDDPNHTLQGDAFITSRVNVACFVRTADCVPILVADPARRVVGAIHAGWRSIVKNVIGATIARMSEAFGSKPEDMCAAIGPAICGSCYEVGRDVVDAFLENDMPSDGRVLCKHDGKTLLNMEWAAEELLTRAHVRRRNIDVIKRCTYENPALASYRRDKTDVRQVSYIFVARRSKQLRETSD